MNKEKRKSFIKAVANTEMSLSEAMMLLGTIRVFIDYWNLQSNDSEQYGRLAMYYEDEVNKLLVCFGLSSFKALDFVND